MRIVPIIALFCWLPSIYPLQKDLLTDIILGTSAGAALVDYSLLSFSSKVNRAEEVLLNEVPAMRSELIEISDDDLLRMPNFQLIAAFNLERILRSERQKELFRKYCAARVRYIRSWRKVLPSIGLVALLSLKYYIKMNYKGDFPKEPRGKGTSSTPFSSRRSEKAKVFEHLGIPKSANYQTFKIALKKAYLKYHPDKTKKTMPEWLTRLNGISQDLRTERDYQDFVRSL